MSGPLPPDPPDSRGNGDPRRDAGNGDPRRAAAGRGFPLLDIVRGARATQALIAANVAVYLLMVAGLREEIITRGALLVADGHLADRWRLATSAFIHFTGGHLLLNMFGLTIFGSDLERRLGPVRYGVIYLMAALAGGLLTVARAGEGLLVAAGASGAIFGLMGAWVAVLFRARGRSSTTGFAPLLIYVVLALAMGAGDPTIGNDAHAGGAGAGFLLGMLLDRPAPGPATAGPDRPSGGSGDEPPPARGA